MAMAFEFSQAQGLCTQQDVTRVGAHMAAIKMPQIKDVAHLFKDPGKLLTHMGQDKKNEGAHLTLILARKIGESFVDKRADRKAVSNYLKSVSERLDAKRGSHVG